MSSCSINALLSITLVTSQLRMTDVFGEFLYKLKTKKSLCILSLAVMLKFCPLLTYSYLLSPVVSLDQGSGVPLVQSHCDVFLM